VVSDIDDSVVCQSYTRARRHPLLIGKIQGHALPVMVSPTQLAVLVIGVIGLVKTRGLWGPLVGGGQTEIVVIVALPAAAAFAARHLRMEGRSPLRMALGVATYAGRRSVGTEMLGRPVRERTPRRVGRAKVFISAPAGVAARLVEAVDDEPVEAPLLVPRRRAVMAEAASPMVAQTRPNRPGRPSDADPVSAVLSAITARVGSRPAATRRVRS
jgi:hypothetical protein